MLLGGGQHGTGRELGALIGDGHAWLAEPLDSGVSSRATLRPEIDVFGVAAERSWIVLSTWSGCESAVQRELVDHEVQ